MPLTSMSSLLSQKSSPSPTNGRHTVGDGAAIFDNDANVLAVCQLQGADNLYYYSTTFSGGPREKCPPDGGSSSCVTGNSTPFAPLLKHIIPTSFSHSSYDASLSSVMPSHPISNRQFSRSISTSATSNNSDMLTPPLTPDSFDHCGTGNFPTQNSKASKDTLDFLLTLFPRHGLAALPYAKSMSISAPNLGAAFDGVILDLPGEQRTLYVDGSSAESVNLRESIVALLDLADERLGCSGLVIALDRSCLNLGALLHSLMYVGGTVITRPPFEVDATFILVGLEV